MTPHHPQRRSILSWACGGAIATWVPTARAQAGYPVKPVMLIAPTVPGGALDGVARLIANKLDKRLGQPVVVENRPGVGGSVGLQLAARAPADGHTLVIAADAYLTVSPRVLKGATTQIKDFAPVIQLGSSPMVLVAQPALGVKTMAEFVARAKAMPNKISYASGGVGSPHHLNMAMLEKAAGIQLNHLPYKGAPQGFADLLGGHVDAMFIVLSTAESQIRSGKLVALGMSSARRVAEQPSIPTIAETVAGYEAEFWFALLAPAATPAAVVRRLNLEVREVLKDPEVLTGLKNFGMTPGELSSEGLARNLAREDQRMEALIRQLDIKPE